MSDREKGSPGLGLQHMNADRMILWTAVVAILGTCAYLVYSQHSERTLIERQVALREQQRQEKAEQRRQEKESKSKESEVSEKSHPSRASRKTLKASTQPQDLHGRQQAEQVVAEVDFDRDYRQLWDSLQEDMYLLGQIQVRQSDDLIAIDDWCRLHKLIMKYTDASLWPSMRTLVYHRRQCLRQSDEAGYRALVGTIFEQEELVNTKVTMAVCQHFGIKLKQYSTSYEIGHNELNNEEVSMQIVQMRINLRKKEARNANPSDLTKIVPREISRDEALAIFDFQSEMQVEATRILQQVADHYIEQEHNVQDALFMDRLFLRFGIEKEDFQLAFEKHELANDPAVQERHADIADSIPTELTQKITTQWLQDQQGNEEGLEEPNSASYEMAE